MSVRVLSFIICLMFSFTASASSLKEVIQEYTYEIEVAGAALNPVAKKEANEKFIKNLKALKQKGFTHEDILLGALDGIQNLEVKKNLTADFKRFDLNNLSQEDAEYLIDQVILHTKVKGASWTGEVGMLLMGMVGITAVMFGLMYVVSINQSCPRNYSDEVCATWDPH